VAAESTLVMPTNTFTLNVSGFARHLIDLKLIAAAEAQRLIANSQAKKTTFVASLIAENLLDEKFFAKTIADYFGFDFADLSLNDQKVARPNHLTADLQRKHNALLIGATATRLTIAIADPTNLPSINALKFHCNVPIQFVIAEHAKLVKLIATDAIEKSIVERKQQTKTSQDDSSTTHDLDLVLNEAINKGASDIHIEPSEFTLRLRYRIDGILYEIRTLDLSIAAKINARLKIFANLDIAEKRLPQDGRFTFKTLNNKSKDCRVSTCPTMFGEKVVVRVLNPTNTIFNLDQLGFEPQQKNEVLQQLQKPQGMFLVTGPTGSGKTLTLYAMLDILNSTTKNISTIEDPIEINLPGINQTEVNSKIGLSFSTALRAFLRQDPDIIMVGEIRDRETADIAIKAAQTGHFVLATLHTNSTVEAITRLRNMGIETFNLAASLNIIIAQRLARKLCSFCKNNLQGCEHSCENCKSGYSGRVGVFEVLSITEEIKAMIIQHDHTQNIENLAKKNGLVSLRKSGLIKVKQGITSIEEINRVIN
jgi:type IV pilus assembly protein PilB